MCFSSMREGRNILHHFVYCVDKLRETYHADSQQKQVFPSTTTHISCSAFNQQPGYNTTADLAHQPCLRRHQLLTPAHPKQGATPSSSSPQRGRTLPHAITGTGQSRRPSRGPRQGPWRPQRTAPRSGRTPPRLRCPPDRQRPGSCRCPRRPGAGRPAHTRRRYIRHGTLHCMPHRLLASCLCTPPACAACCCTHVLTVETPWLIEYSFAKRAELDTGTHQRHRGRGNEHGGHGHRRRCCTLSDVVLADDRGCGEANSVSRAPKPRTACYAAQRSGVGLTACHRPCCRCWRPGTPPVSLRRVDGAGKAANTPKKATHQTVSQTLS